MRVEKRVLALDLDDVLKDTWHVLCLFSNQHYHTKISPKDLTSINLDDLWKCSQAEKERRLWYFYHSDHHDAGIPVLGAVSALKTLSKDFELHIVTGRPRNVRHKTVPWIEKHFPNTFADIHLTGGSFGLGEISRQKSEVCRNIGAHAFVDDWTENVAEVSKLSINTLLFTTPINRRDALPMGVTRVHNWEEIVTHLSK